MTETRMVRQKADELGPLLGLHWSPALGDTTGSTIQSHYAVTSSGIQWAYTPWRTGTGRRRTGVLVSGLH
jgi:hypothetical protein